MDINEATAKALSAERAASGLTIKELVEKSGIPERTLIRVLKGERDINMLQISKLAPIYGMQPHEIIVEAERYIARDRRNAVINAGDHIMNAEDREREALRRAASGDYDLAAYDDGGRWGNGDGYE